MWELDNKKGWVPKNWCLWTAVLEKTLASPLDCKEIKAVNPKGNKPWIFIGRTDAEAPILWPPDAKSWLIRKKPWHWEKLRAGGEGGDRDWDGWMALNGREFRKLWEMMKDTEAWRAAVCGVTKSWSRLSYWTNNKKWRIQLTHKFNTFSSTCLYS